MMARFCRYIEKVFDFGERIAKLKDHRLRPRIPTSAIWGSVFFLFVMRQRSLNAMEGQLRQPKRMERLIGNPKPSADRMGEVLGLIHPDLLRSLLSGINHQVGRNKALQNGWPLRVGAMDGHEFFSSRRRCCPECSKRMVKVKKEKVVEYHHRGVVFHLIGFPIAMPLDVEMVRPGEGEVTAAKRLLARVAHSYGRFFDVVLADALYCEAPFLNDCLSYGKQVITVLKGDKRALLQDAKGVFSLLKPKIWKGPGQLIQAWDAEEFTSADGVQVPLRVIHTQEAITKRHRQAGQWVQKVENHSWWWATTLPASQAPTRLFWKIAHGRWEIENDLFHTLVTYWSLDHCFKHEPTAILNFILTLFIAFVLLQSFYQGNLKPQRRTHLSLIGMSQELFFSLALLDSAAPWLVRGG